MIFRASFLIDTGGDHPFEVYECGTVHADYDALWREALGAPLASLEGSKGKALIAPLKKAVKLMRDPKEYLRFQALVAPGRAGGIGMASTYLEAIQEGAELHPKAFIHFWRHHGTDQ